MSKLTRRQVIGGAAAALAGCNNKSAYWATQSGAADDTIVRAAIHPGIGIARVGNSPDGYFIGPEVVEPSATQQGASRDATGALKRQAARFRIFGFNAQGQVVRELTPDTADIDWFVQLANKKAAWYRFVAAMDLPDSATLSTPRRNPAVTDRASLVAGNGTKTIKGKSTSGPAYRFDTTLFGAAFSLGEVRTDDTGRLLVLGGLGKSGSPANRPIYTESDADSFNNADGWYDDTSDGPVTAVVRLSGGRQIPVESAWVIVAPPNYAPDVVGWRTMYDLLTDTYIDANMLSMPSTTSFAKDVLPALRRLSNLQWVNHGFSETYRRGQTYDFDDPAKIAALNNKGASSAPLRQQIQQSFRPPGTSRKNWPWLYGDGYGTYESSSSDDLSVSKLRALHLQRWADGNFTDDWNASAPSIHSIDQVALNEQPQMLDQAALHFCLADAFHPGCEMTWPMRHASLYSAPFRVKRRDESKPEPDYGDAFTQAIALKVDGPLYSQSAGDLTKWMALPWQGDTVFCRSGYEPAYDPYLPTFWPARVPNHVLTAEDYATAIDPSKTRDARIAAFRNRASWTRAMTGNPPAQMVQMVSQFAHLGVVEARPGVPNDPDLPATMFVESLPPAALRSAVGAMKVGAPGGGAPGGPGGIARNDRGGGVIGGPSEHTPTTKAGWTDEAQLEAFRQIRVRRRPR
jgi:hypothetical protein